MVDVNMAGDDEEVPQVVLDFRKAQELEESNPAQAEPAYVAIISSDQETEEGMKVQEKSAYALGQLYVKSKAADKLERLAKDIRPFCIFWPKARTAKMIRALIDYMGQIPDARENQIEMCTDCVGWCKEEKRNFLRQRVETKLASLYVASGIYSKAEAVINSVSSEVKKLDDKLLLTEIHLIESILYFEINNLAKAKAALTASKTKANAIHCPPLLQAEIDLRSGILCMREKDFNTAYSYFYESFEAFHQAHDKRAGYCLKYMLLDRIMQETPDEVTILAAGKTFLKYLGAESEALITVAKALKARSLKDFETAKSAHEEVIAKDEIMSHHISNLYETLLQKNLLRIVEPYSHIQLSQVAKLIDLPIDLVQDKLSEMILDGKFEGTLDQGKGVVIVFDRQPISTTYENVLKSITNTSDVLNNMARKAQLLI